MKIYMPHAYAFLFALCSIIRAYASSEEWIHFEDFEATQNMATTLESVGTVKIAPDRDDTGHVLELSKDESNLREPASATLPAFPVQPGSLEISFSAQSDLTSWDNSYNGILYLQFLTDTDDPLSTSEVGAWFKNNPWERNERELEVPEGAVKARFIAKINKETPGYFRLDDLGVKWKATERPADGLRRMMFTMEQLGHLLYPEDARIAEVEVWSGKELPKELTNIGFTVRDYWGGEQNVPIINRLEPDGMIEEEGMFKYKTLVDLSDVSLEIGRYYELHGEILRDGAEPFTNYTSFAILPEAAANSYKPEDIPFTSRTWDQRMVESPPLTKRLGVRICNVRVTFDPSKEELKAYLLNEVHDLDMASIPGPSPAWYVEQRQPGWEKLLANDGLLIREKVQAFFQEYGHLQPMVFVLGNEPHNKGEAVAQDVEAYRIVYEEIKRHNPDITVVGTSIGTNEEYFKAGFGKWCDAYDFHSYESPENVRKILEVSYPAMFEKYGHSKPIWSTELGMNSQGMARSVVAGLLYKNFANFFAGGGANASWFGLFYPDPEGKNHDTFAWAHNIFDCRYNKYAPKLDAIAYYNAVNGIAVKEFIEDRKYDRDEQLFLFRDMEGASLIIAYCNTGERDVRIPLPGAKDAEVIRIDGTRDSLSSNQNGISLTLNESPVLVFYQDGPDKLPEHLDIASVTFGQIPERIAIDGTNTFEVLLNGAKADTVSLQLPPFWEVIDRKADAERILYRVKAYEESTAKEARIDLVMKDANAAHPGVLLSRLIQLEKRLSLELEPIPAVDKRGPAIRLKITNNSSKEQVIDWNLKITGEQTLKSGEYTPIKASLVCIADTDSGTIQVPAREVAIVEVALEGVQPLTVYQVKASVQGRDGQSAFETRPMAGFVPVYKTGNPVTIDGALDESAWEHASVEVLDQSDQYCSLVREGRESNAWQGPQDLSAKIRYLWDEDFLYVSVQVTDDIAGPLNFADSNLWRMDGLQFLVDPARGQLEKPGKYEYSISRGAKGVQAWCTLSASSDVPTGPVSSIRAGVQRDQDQSMTTYEIAIPWPRLAPFEPKAYRDLGLTLIINEDDGNGRDAFMTWFGNAHNKNIDTVGDLVLLP
ncbi:sugar-binding protein [Cerasicoccus fimbriatus]|uniref:sugar-binding protein n=1 Tax=Cerasicoccus fimbriatus TaxID=3014554 RepID=UPI0022B34303|nr:sugar-binding protein [Cerasicoccus sp. TK19100]